jgi:hypothetical protein
MTGSGHSNDAEPLKVSLSTRAAMPEIVKSELESLIERFKDWDNAVEAC